MSEYMTHPIFQDLTSEDVALEQLFLDPNNPRFITMDWDYIQDDYIEDSSIQEEVLRKMVAHYSVNSLVTNMEINGYLPIDRVIVKAFADNKYYVLEGNRRIAAAKILKQKILNGDAGISAEIASSLQQIPVLIYTGDDDEASWIFQGLRHIMGVKDWSAYNKAKLLVKLMDEEGLSLTEVGKKFGLSSFGAGQWARGYYALMQAKEDSDYTGEIDERVFPFFQELFNRSNASLREWMNWDDRGKKFSDELKFNEFLSWLYPKDVEDFSEEESIIDIKGEWSERKIRTAQNLRNLSYIIRNSSREFENFRNEKELDKSYNRVVQSEYQEEAKKVANPTEDAIQSITQCSKALQELPFTVFKNQELLNKILEELNDLEAKISSIKEFAND